MATTPTRVWPESPSADERPEGSEPRGPKHVKRARAGRWLRLFGKLCLSAAVLIGLYVVWLFWGTGIYTARVQGDLKDDLKQRIVASEDAGREPRELPKFKDGEGWAILEIPRLDDGNDPFSWVVVEGTSSEALRDGPGHYDRTHFPWEEEGVVGIAGHRTTYGAPFWDLDKLRKGHKVRLVTEVGVYRYEITETREVSPGDTEVLRDTDHPTLVLTTCSPKFSAARRLIIFADLLPVAGGDAGDEVLSAA